MYKPEFNHSTVKYKSWDPTLYQKQGTRAHKNVKKAG